MVFVKCVCHATKINNSNVALVAASARSLYQAATRSSVIQLAPSHVLGRGFVKRSDGNSTPSVHQLSSYKTLHETHRFPIPSYNGIRMNSNVSDLEEKVIVVPSMGDSISEGQLGSWNKRVGEFVEEDEIIAIIETDKIAVEILCPLSGILRSIEAQEGDDVFVGDPLYTIKPTTDSSEADVTLDSTTEPIDDSVTSSTASLRKETTVPMSRIRQRIAERLKGAQEAAAALTTFNEVDLTSLIALRSELNDLFKERHGVKLGFMSPFILACTRALEKYPDVNASIVDKKNITYRNFVDISVAVSTPTGLMVPVIRDCNQKTFVDFEKELIELATKARTGQISIDEVTGGTFTISNGGTYGSMLGTPLLNPPQSAILGMHNIIQRPVVVQGKICIRPMMYLALTYDHCIIDGREAVLFLKMVKELLEDPRRILINV